jgi:beta-1,4-mannosyl-glycoprotein beta-1,4-N-acetylglucosaminyltransferase
MRRRERATWTARLIYDCFTYAGEDELLYLRLKTLDGVVHRFVIAEGTRTFAGAPREPRFEAARFAPWAARITYLRVDDLEAAPASAWVNEYRQRNALARGLAAAQASDLVVLSDVDEIPHPDALRAYRPRRYFSGELVQRFYWYAFNNQMVRSAVAGDVPWCRARITTVGRLRGWYGTLQNLREFKPAGPWRSVLRYLHRHQSQRLEPGGWHFSYLMTPEQIRRKIESFSHQELNLPQFTDVAHIREALQSRRDLFGAGREFEVVPLDASFPRPLLEERERFAAWIF